MVLYTLVLKLLGLQQPASLYAYLNIIIIIIIMMMMID